MQINQLPTHIAFIMDGNRRWAKKRNLPVFEGHRQGFQTAKKLMLYGKKLGIPYSTVYAFSTENWKRAEEEVKFLLLLLEWLVKNELQTMIKEEIGVRVIGSKELLNEKIIKLITLLEEQTQHFNSNIVQIAFNYGGREEITNAVKKIVSTHPSTNTITEQLISKNLYTSAIPDPDIMIRTGGELRLSNFLLWQLSYAELYFTETLWPDFDEKELDKALTEFSRRKRNFGK
ncbi:MAG: polyprenyl diphosphate synthase [bacterium]